ncbi:Macrolide export ATP-binding/permease protein MacB [Serratia plymuthica]|uniref:Macrolide export ATP-binding/permease protein MacB n=1 Tax=Serratia plymuthica TaxID=82996 RepID=A0A2X4UQM9_SERPL|nr:Macrolide export ATP-binding/permease protein MacB [Serratia plymuthica]
MDAVERVNVGAQVSGQVKSLKVKLGDRVTQGQPIADIDDLPQRNDLRNAEAALNVAKADLQAKQALLKQAESRFKRQKRMLNDEASSLEDFEAAEATLTTTRAELIALNARIVQAQIEVDKKKVDLSYTRILAPMDGIVIAVITQQGQTVNANQSAPTIVKLARLDLMTIKAQISEADITRVSQGQKAYFTIFSDPEKRYDATLRTVELAPESVMKDDSLSGSSSASGSGTSNASVYYNALLDVPNPDNRLRIAMTAQVSLLLGEAKNTLLVPIQAVRKTEDKKQQVQVLTANDRLEMREVKTGITNNVDIQILSGLKAGENRRADAGKRQFGRGWHLTVNNIIELKGISRTYTNSAQPLTVLKNINLTIAAGELVAIIGASGSGKSTLMNIMGCLDVPDQGDYYIGGQNAAHLSPDELARLRREHIGFIFQRYHLMPDISALGNVEIPAIYANDKRDQRRLRAAQLLARLGLEGRENHKPGQLSGGQQQRVSIARSLINGGEIILADEPTGALDSKSGQEVLAILSELNQRGHTVVIVTHDMKVAQHAQRIIELQDGEVIADSGCKSPALPMAQPTAVRVRQGYWQSLLDRTRESLQNGSEGDECPPSAHRPDHDRHHFRHRCGSNGSRSGRRSQTAHAGQHQRSRHQCRQHLPRPRFL